jgi:hypothetical protein
LKLSPDDFIPAGLRELKLIEQALACRCLTRLGGGGCFPIPALKVTEGRIWRFAAADNGQQAILS